MTRMVLAVSLVGVVLGASFLMPQTPRRDLDKNGTTPLKSECRRTQPVDLTEVATCGSLEAERAGFEPAVSFYTYAALAKLCYRPLSHLSGLPLTKGYMPGRHGASPLPDASLTFFRPASGAAGAADPRATTSATAGRARPRCRR